MHSLKIPSKRKLLYSSIKHALYIYKRFDRIYLDHPDADKHNILISANPENANEMEIFKGFMNNLIDNHNSLGIDYERMGKNGF